MKKNVMLAALALVSTIVLAQHKQVSPDQIATRQSDRMKSVLLLTDTQYASVKTINGKYAEKQMTLRNDQNLSREARHEKMKSLREEKNVELQQVLTKDQQVKWKEFQSAQVKKRLHRKDGNAQHLKEALSLTDDQFTKVQAVNKEFLEKKSEIKNNSSLSQEASKAALKKLKDEHETKLKGVLTDAQFQQWLSLKSEHKTTKGKKRDH